MKKQFLFFTMFVLALMAGSSISYGQDGADHYSDPRPLTCVDDALHPIAGRQYVYEADGVAPGGNWHFWATKDPDFITSSTGTPVFNSGTAITVGAGQLEFASVDYNINTNTDGAIELIWSSSILSNTLYQGTPDPTGATPSPTFIVAYYVDVDGCTDNIKVWELDPLNGFTVDVLALEPDAVTTMPAYDPATLPEDCFSPVESATYVGGGTGMVYDYGENYLYFEFVAANFTDYWIPTFGIDETVLGATQSIIGYQYTYSQPADWDGTETWTDLVSGTTRIDISSTFAGDIEDGVSVFVRALVDHDKWEGIAPQTLTMILDGQNADGDWDVENGTGADTCVDPLAADQNDTADVTLTQRPTVTDPAMPAPNLIPGDEQN